MHQLKSFYSESFLQCETLKYCSVRPERSQWIEPRALHTEDLYSVSGTTWPSSVPGKQPQRPSRWKALSITRCDSKSKHDQTKQTKKDYLKYQVQLFFLFFLLYCLHLKPERLYEASNNGYIKGIQSQKKPLPTLQLSFDFFHSRYFK